MKFLKMFMDHYLVKNFTLITEELFGLWPQPQLNLLLMSSYVHLKHLKLECKPLTQSEVFQLKLLKLTPKLHLLKVPLDYIKVYILYGQDKFLILLLNLLLLKKLSTNFIKESLIKRPRMNIPRDYNSQLLSHLVI